MKWNEKALGLALGIIWGVTVLIATLGVVLRGGTGEITGKLARFYLGYSTTMIGAFIGLIWGFIHAFIVGYVLAILYNTFNKAVTSE